MTLRPSSAAAPPGTGRALALAFAAFALLQLTLAVVWVVPGPLSVDEVLYEWMTRNAAEGRPLHVANGYEETPSPELTPERFVRTEGGRLTVQYPVLWSMTAAPLYRAFGYRALFLLNALALAGVMLFTWRIGLRLLGSAPAALAGCLLLGAGTYAWEYSVAAWPHMATLLLQVAAFDTVLEAREAKGRRAFVAALVAGGLAGLAVGFRRDAVFLLPVLALLLLWEGPPRWRALAGLALGAAAPLLLLAWLNALRWGVWSPLSYGRAEPRYRVVGVVGLAGFVGLALLGRADARRALLRRWRPVVLAGAAAYLALLLVPATAERALTAARGVENVLVDLRGAPSDTGRYYWAVIWFGGVKKSLLQSLPWLPLLALPVWRAWRTPGRRAALVTLLLPVAVYAGVPALLDRHGGMSLNLRYLLPGLPFLALLGAWAALEVAGAVRSRSESRRAALGAGGAGVLAAAAGWAWLAPRDFVSREAETAVLDAPLVLAGLAAAAVTWWILRAGRGAGGRGGGGRGVQGGGAAASAAVLLVGAAAVTWSGAMAFDYDARWSREIRERNHARATAVADAVPAGAFVFGDFVDWHGTVPAHREGVAVAFPHRDGFADMPFLALHHLRGGRPVFGALTGPSWRAAGAAGALAGLAWTPVGDGGGGVEIRRLRLPEGPGREGSGAP